MAYDSTKPVTGGSLVAADMRENFRALKEDDIVEGVAAGGIVAGMIGAAQVTNAKLGTGSVTNAKLGTNSVIEVKINAGAVTNAKLGTGAVTNAKLGTGSVTSVKLGTSAVVEAKINTAAVTNTKLGTGAVIEVKLGASAVSQAKLKTSQGSVSADLSSGSGTDLTLPGGEYGFYPQTKGEVADTSCVIDVKISGTKQSTTYITNIYLKNAGTSTRYIYAQQRYVTASGEIHWVFILKNKITKQITSIYQAPDHPCFGNGSKPLLMPHPFGDYDKTKHEIIVINPTNEEIEQMELETIVDDETKPDKDLLEVITENYEIDEGSNPAWPSIPVTVGLPKHIIDKETGKKILADYRFMPAGTVIEPIKKVIPRPSYIQVKKLKKK